MTLTHIALFAWIVTTAMFVASVMFCGMPKRFDISHVSWKFAIAVFASFGSIFLSKMV